MSVGDLEAVLESITSASSDLLSYARKLRDSLDEDGADPAAVCLSASCQSSFL